MSFPAPVPGLVIRYSYLWRDEFLKGQEEGVKDRPCALVLVTHTEDGDEIATVVPITHSLPRDTKDALEIPRDVKSRLGLDDERSWIVLTEANRFVWPGPDLRPAIRGDASSIAYGTLPNRFYAEVLARFLESADTRRAKITSRTE
ncbi:MAG: hypothetical protein AB7E79_17230 [Rhodospirillaceae bacterium]